MRFERLAKSFWSLQIAGWLVYLLLIYLTFLSVATEGSFVRLFHIKIVRTVIGFVLTVGLWQLYKHFVQHRSTQIVVASVLILSIFFGCLWTAIESFYAHLTSDHYDIMASLPRMPRIALDYAVTIMAWSAIYFGIKYHQQSQEERERALAATLFAEKAQLDMLRYQLNPHFLFNALNSIRATVDEDGTTAKQMITQLSEFLRYSLLSTRVERIPLEEEIEVVKNYLAIEKIRFEDRLIVTWSIDPESVNRMIPPYLLIPLVENAIKHGMHSSSKALNVLIRTQCTQEALTLIVSNSGTMSPSSRHGESLHVGLKNVNDRLKRIYAEKSTFKIEERSDQVVVTITLR